MTEPVTETKSSVLPAKKRRSGIPTGNAGEYFVMGELLRRGFDAQLADRNTRGYDVLTGRPEDKALHKVQIKTVRSAPWYVSVGDFEGDRLDMVTIYVLLGPEDGTAPVRFFIARNRDLRADVHRPPKWEQVGNKSGFISLSSVIKGRHEGNWDILRSLAE